MTDNVFMIDNMGFSVIVVSSGSMGYGLVWPIKNIRNWNLRKTTLVTIGLAHKTHSYSMKSITHNYIRCCLTMKSLKLIIIKILQKLKTQQKQPHAMFLINEIKQLIKESL